MYRPSARELAKAREVLKAEKAARRADRGQRVQHKAAKPAHGRERDEGYLSWLHEGLSCIACDVLGQPARPGRIEAAHQKINAADRGVQKRLGVRPSDIWCLPLCESHHRSGPLCCDPAQAKFWAQLGLSPGDVADFCRALYAAFLAEGDGEAVVRRFAVLADAQRRDV